MIYGNEPIKHNGLKSYFDDVLKPNAHTYVPDIMAIMQSRNLYVYCINNPIMFHDPNGESATEILSGSWTIGGGAALIDGPLPFGDAVGLIIIIGGTVIAGGVTVWDYFSKKPVNLPSYKKIEHNMGHIMSGHSMGGNRGGPDKDRFPIEMTAPAIEKAIIEAYRYGEKIYT